MRLPLIFIALCAALSIALPAASRAAEFKWSIASEKSSLAADGVEYHKYYLDTSRGGMHIHTVKVACMSGHALMPVIANDKLNTVAHVDKLASKVGAVAAINGGFFDTGKTRLPVGLVKIKRRIVFEQFLNRGVLGIDEHGLLHFDRFQLHSHVYIPSTEDKTVIHGYNRKRKLNELILYTPEFGPTTRTNEFGVELVLHRISPDTVEEPFVLLEPDRYIITGVNQMDSTIPSDGAVLSIHKPMLASMPWLRSVKLGQEIQVKSNVPPGWESFPYLLGGGPMLLKNGKIVLDPKREGFGSYFSRANARTAVGSTEDGDSVIIVVDAAGASGGATWEELCILCRDMLGCSGAMGFDGGGSSTMFVGDDIVNSPSGGGLRKVANILAVVPFEKFI